MTGSNLSPPGSHPSPAPRRRPSLFRRLRRDQRGAAAVEMALVSVPFFALLGAIMEGALNFWSTQVLETAVQEASRQIYTGQFQDAQRTGGVPAGQHAEKFREIVCREVEVMMSCADGNLRVDVRTFENFPNPARNPVANGELDPTFGAFQPIGPNQIVVVRAAIEKKVIFSLLDANKSNLSSGVRMIIASAAFRTEPFPTAATP